MVDSRGAESTDQAVITVIDTAATVSVPGDINEDGVKNVSDKILILINRGKPVSSCPLCDVDQDGDIDNIDVFAWYRL